MKKIRNYIYYFFVGAFAGWVYEVLWFIIMRNKFVNRGFLFGPWLPVYGFGSILVIFLLGPMLKKKIKVWKINITPIIVFLLIALIATVVEYVAHYVLDTYFGIILWDYSKDYWNYQGRVCFAATRNFAIGGIALLYLIKPLCDKMFKKVKDKKQTMVALALLGLIMIDFIVKIF